MLLTVIQFQRSNVPESNLYNKVATKNNWIIGKKNKIEKIVKAKHGISQIYDTCTEYQNPHETSSIRANQRSTL